MSAYACQSCELSFTTRAGLNCHARQHAVGDRLFKCEQCPKSYRQLGGLIVHRRVHDGVKPFRCAVCSAAFRQRQGLQSHLLTHFARTVTCELCQKQLASREALRIHRWQVHTRRKEFQCNLCEKVFKASSCLSYHRRMLHYAATARQYRCCICLRQLKGRRSMIRHLDTHNGARDRPKCRFCVGVFANKHTARNHEHACHFIELTAMTSWSREGLAAAMDPCGEPDNMPGSLHPRLYGCSTCYLFFDTKLALTSHCRYFHPAPARCRACFHQPRTTVASDSRLTEHDIGGIKNIQYTSIQTNSKKKKWCRCAICLFLGEGRTDIVKVKHLCRHQKSLGRLLPYSPGVIQQKRFQCALCAVRFKDRTAIIRHLHRHRVDSEILLSNTRDIASVSLRARTIATIEDTTAPIFCAVCCLQLDCKGCLAVHLRRFHRGMSKRQFACAQCLLTFVDKGNLCRHLRCHGIYYV